MNEAQIQRVLADVRTGHSEFQIEHFILGQNGLTPWGMRRQCLREIAARWEALKLDEIRRRRLMTQSHLDTGLVDIDSAKSDLDTYEARANLESLNRQMAERERELRFLLSAEEALSAQVGELTPETEAILETEYWAAVFTARAKAEIAAHGAPSVASFEMFDALPNEAKKLTGEVMRLQCSPSQQT